MLRFKVILILTFVYSLSFSQIIVPKGSLKPDYILPRYTFGISFCPTHDSQQSYALIRVFYDGQIEVQHLNYDRFIQQISGAEKSPANPEQINYLEQYQLNPEDFNDLWKLRFSKHPYKWRTEKGYGNKYGTLTPAQFEMLKPYGIQHIEDFAYGDKMWLLMQKTVDPQWKSLFSAAGQTP